MTKVRKIPKATITRLSMYYRQLELLEFDGYRMVSSEKLAWLCQINPAQVRKDLGYFGEFGVRGVGYDVIDLQTQIKKILSLNRDWNLGIAGMGNMGCAIFLHRNLALRGFKCVAAFDNAPARIGMPLPGGMEIQDIGELKKNHPESEHRNRGYYDPAFRGTAGGGSLYGRACKCHFEFCPHPDQGPRLLSG